MAARSCKSIIGSRNKLTIVCIWSGWFLTTSYCLSASGYFAFPCLGQYCLIYKYMEIGTVCLAAGSRKSLIGSRNKLTIVCIWSGWFLTTSYCLSASGYFAFPCLGQYCLIYKYMEIGTVCLAAGSRKSLIGSRNKLTIVCIWSGWFLTTSYCLSASGYFAFPCLGQYCLIYKYMEIGTVCLAAGSRKSLIGSRNKLTIVCIWSGWFLTTSYCLSASGYFAFSCLGQYCLIHKYIEVGIACLAAHSCKSIIGSRNKLTIVCIWSNWFLTTSYCLNALLHF